MTVVCKECKHFRSGFGQSDYLAYCGKAFTVEPVTGRKEYEYCNRERNIYLCKNNDTSCGPEGKNFEPKVSFFKRIFK